MPSAVIVRTQLPSDLERLRRRCIRNAGDGVPAHLTLLYPFVEPGDLGTGVRRSLSTIADRHASFAFEQCTQAAWPDTLYVAVRPVAPFVRLQRELQAAFPDYPIYGTDVGFEFVPHISIAEGEAIHDPVVFGHRAWATLPRPARADAIEVIATGADGHWRLVWRVRLGHSRPGPVGRMPS